MAMKLREQILQANDLKSENVTVKEWGVTIQVREMSAGDRERMLKQHSEYTKKGDNTAAVCSVIEQVSFDPETGERIFEDGDTEKLAEKCESALLAIYRAAMKISGISLADDDGEPEAGKSSEKTQDSGQTTDSCTSLESEDTAS